MVTRHFERKKAQMSATTNNTGDESKKKDDSDFENAASDSDEVEKSPKKDKPPAKSNVKLTKKAEESEDENDDDDEEDEEKKPGLLDLPLEVSGARERKKVERLHLSFNVPGKEKKTDIPDGLGLRLGECPRIEMNLQKVKVDDLKLFHRLLFNRPGTPNEIKKNIKRFSGFPFAMNSPEYEKKRNNIDKLTRPMLKQICEILDLERGGTKEDVVIRLLEFLMKPSPSGKALPQPKKKKSSSPSSSKRPSKKKGAKNSKNTKKKSSDADSASNDDIDNSMDEDDDGKTEDREDSEGESEEDKIPKKKEKKPVTKARGKKEEKNSAKGNKKRKAVISSDDESSNDEPLVKKGKQLPPTDDELKTYIKSILDGANLEEITMKTVCKQVFSHYPDFDLSTRKEFIKSTVRSIIS